MKAFLSSFVAVVVIGAAVHNTASAGANSASAMTPARVLYKIREVERESWDPRIAGGRKVADAIRVTKAVLGRTSVSITGRCKAKQFDPNLRTMRENQSAATLLFCWGHRSVYKGDSGKHIYMPHPFTADLRKLGTRAARSIAIRDAEHGDATRIVATPRSARFWFRRSSTAASGTRQLRTLTLRRDGQPILVWYIDQ
jgi:hypothetical protein